MTRRKFFSTRTILTAGALLCAAGAVGGLIYAIANGGSMPPPRVVSEVIQLRLIQPPPPPPPPPLQSPQQKMIEQPQVRQQEFKAEHVDNKPPAPRAPGPPGPPALDAKGQGPGDAFGLEGRPGGGDYVGGGEGGGGGSKYGWYAALLTGRAEQALQKARKLNRARFRVVVQMWLSIDGIPQRVELVTSTGSTDHDHEVVKSLSEMGKLPEPPPKDMPEPVVMAVNVS